MPVEKTSSRGKKLFYYLSRMSLSDRDEFARWLISPLHGNSAQLLKIHELLLQLMGEERQGLKAEDFQGIISPEAELDPKKEKYIWVRLAGYQNRLYDFLAWKAFQRDPELQSIYLVKEMIDRDWDKYLAALRKSRSNGKATQDQARSIRWQLELETSYASYFARKKQQNPDLALVQGKLDQYFLIEKLKYACAGVIFGDVTADPEQQPLLQAALSEAERRHQAGRALPLISAYFSAFRMLSLFLDGDAASDRYFQTFLQLLQHNTELSAGDLRDLFVHGQNYCVLQYRGGDTTYIDQLQDLYELVLERQLVFDDGILSPRFYRNTVELMCKFGRFSWAEAFVYQYRERLPVDSASIMHAFNLAIIRFHTENYDRVTELLNQNLSVLDKWQMGVGARVYFCRALWLREDYDWLLSVLRAFEQHLNRNRYLNPGGKKRYKGFVKYLRTAAMARSGNPNQVRGRIEKLLAKIEAQEPPNLYRWLRQELQAAL